MSIFFSKSACPIWHVYHRFHCPRRSPIIMAGPKPTSSARSSPTILGAFHSLWLAYNEQTTDRLKFIDSFLLFIMLSGMLQFMYCILVSNFPFNAFLAGYALVSSVSGHLILTDHVITGQVQQHNWSIRIDGVLTLADQPRK